MTLAVIRQGGGWRVFGPNGAWRCFNFKVDAEEAALRLANQEIANAAQVHVLVQDECGELRLLYAA